MSQQAKMSGGPIRPFKKGWALFPFRGKKAHYWTEDTKTMPPTVGSGGRVRFYESACGMSAAADYKIPPLEPGNWGRCRKCARKTHAK